MRIIFMKLSIYIMLLIKVETKKYKHSKIVLTDSFDDKCPELDVMITMYRLFYGFNNHNLHDYIRHFYSKIAKYSYEKHNLKAFMTLIHVCYEHIFNDSSSKFQEVLEKPFLDGKMKKNQKFLQYENLASKKILDLKDVNVESFKINVLDICLKLFTQFLFKHCSFSYFDFVEFKKKIFLSYQGKYFHCENQNTNFYYFEKENDKLGIIFINNMHNVFLLNIKEEIPKIYRYFNVDFACIIMTKICSRLNLKYSDFLNEKNGSAITDKKYQKIFYDQIENEIEKQKYFLNEFDKVAENNIMKLNLVWRKETKFFLVNDDTICIRKYVHLILRFFINESREIDILLNRINVIIDKYNSIYQKIIFYKSTENK